MSYKILKNWNYLLDYFSPAQKDVYFTENYLKLYESKSEKAYCFYYYENDFHFLLPYLLREFQYEDQAYFDFETAYGYGGPIFNYYDDKLITKAWQSFLDYGFQNNYIAGFIRFHPLLNNQVMFETVGELILDRNTVAIDLSLSESKIWEKEIHTKNRNVIKKGETLGLEFIIDHNFNHLDTFKKLYLETMDKVSADSFYYFPSNYYTSLKESLDNCFLSLVKYGDIITSAAIFFYSKEYGHYHLSGNNKQYKKLNSNNFLLYKTAIYLKSIGIKKLHLGGGTNADPNNSLLSFKKKFSESLYDFYIGKLIFNHSRYDAICNDWTISNPQKSITYDRYLLKYKY